MTMKRNKRDLRYIPLEKLKELDDLYLTEIENVKQRLSNIKDAEIIKAFYQSLLSSYNAAIDLKCLEGEVDYDIKCAEIAERKAALKPWRRCWLWRLLLQPTTNRAQDIIESRAKLEADKIHSAAEKEIEDERKKLFEENKKPSKFKLKRILSEKLKAAIKKADEAPTGEAITEPPAPVQTTQEDASKAAKQLPGQITLDEVQTQPQAPRSAQQAMTRRPRPPRSCRKPTT